MLSARYALFLYRVVLASFHQTEEAIYMQRLVLILTVLLLSMLIAMGCTRELTRGGEGQAPLGTKLPGQMSGSQTEGFQKSGAHSEGVTSTGGGEVMPDSSGGSSNPEVNSLMNKGRIAMVQSNYEVAIQKFSKVIDIEPKNVRALYNLGNAYRKTKNADKAVEFSQKAVDADPSLLYVHENLGYAYELQGNTDKAMAQFEDELQRHPNESNLAGIAMELAGIYLQKNLLEEAFDAANKAIKLAPKDPGGYALLADVQTKNGAFDQAIASMQKAVELEPGLAEYQMILGDDLWAGGQKRKRAPRTGRRSSSMRRLNRKYRRIDWRNSK